MKRVFEFRPITEADRPVLSMAAMQGVDLSPMVGGNRFLGWGETKHGFAPIALMDVKETDFVIEPHVTWFPWVSARQRVEAFTWALSVWKKVVFLIIAKEHSAFYEHFLHKGLLRKVGVLHVQKEAGEEIHMYQKIGGINE
jgi:hypothetical protein